MFTFKLSALPSIAIAVRFVYETRLTPIDSDDQYAIRRVTCFMETGEISSVVAPAIGISKCHPNDTFNKAIGRKLALRRALAMFSSNRAHRRLVWNCYHIMSNHPERVVPGGYSEAVRALEAGGVKTLPPVCPPF